MEFKLILGQCEVKAEQHRQLPFQHSALRPHHTFKNVSVSEEVVHQSVY